MTANTRGAGNSSKGGRMWVVEVGGEVSHYSSNRSWGKGGLRREATRLARKNREQASEREKEGWSVLERGAGDGWGREPHAELLNHSVPSIAMV